MSPGDKEVVLKFLNDFWIDVQEKKSQGLFGSRIAAAAHVLTLEDMMYFLQDDGMDMDQYQEMSDTLSTHGNMRFFDDIEEMLVIFERIRESTV